MLFWNENFGHKNAYSVCEIPIKINERRKQKWLTADF